MYNIAVMENLPRWKNFNKYGQFFSHNETCEQGGSSFPHFRLVIFCLGLLNAALLITAVAIGIKCAKIGEGSFHVSNPAVTKLFNELDYLRSNHSDVIEAEEEAKKALEMALSGHAQLKLQIEQQKTVNNGYQRQVEALREEKTGLQANITALEKSCGKCLPGWIFFNSSCYFFSYNEPSAKTWEDSRAYCISWGADLAVIDDKREQEFVSTSILNMRHDPISWKSGAWVGLSDMETEGTWVWINNVTEVEPRYWMDGEPNNLGHRGEQCTVVIHSSTNPWKTRFDRDCGIPSQWICEMSL